MPIDKRAWLERLKKMFVGFDRPLALTVFLLLCVGLVTLYSASLGVPGRVEDQLRNIMLTFVLMWVLATISPQTLMKIAVPLYTFGVAMLVAVALFGITKKGAKRWINVGVVIQPSEILKIATPLMLAWYYQRRESSTRWYDFVVGFAILLLPVGLIAKQPDLGTAVLVFAAGLFVIYFAGLSFKLIMPVLIAAVIGIGLIGTFQGKICQPQVQWPLMHDYQKHRICTLLDPTSDPLGKGLPYDSSRHCNRLGRPARQGLAQGHAGAPRFHPRETYRFHLRRVFGGIRAGGRARAVDALYRVDRTGALYRGQRRDAVRPAARGIVDDGVFHLCVRQCRDGERDLAGRGRAAAVHELRRHRAHDTRYCGRAHHERRPAKAVDEELRAGAAAQAHFARCFLASFCSAWLRSWYLSRAAGSPWAAAAA